MALDWLRRHRTKELFGLNLVVSVSVGYLLEQGLLSTWKPGSWCLLLLGLLTATLGVCLWWDSRSHAAKHGVLINFAAGPEYYRARRAGEQATLLAWAANRYPTSLVMSPLFDSLPSKDDEDEADNKVVPDQIARRGSSEGRTAGQLDDADPKYDRAIGHFAVRAADKVLAAAALAPGSKRFVLLPAGVPEAIVQVAAWLRPLLAGKVVLASDLTGTQTDPFFIFKIPWDGSPSAAEKPPADGAPVVRGLLRRRPPMADANGTLVPADPPKPLCAENVMRFGQQTGDIGYVPEEPSECEAVLAKFADWLPTPEQPGQSLHLVSDAPEALVFGAGAIAAGKGWEVRSAVFDKDSHSYARWSHADVGSLVTQLPTLPAKRRARTFWLARLLSSSVSLGMGIPLAVGAFAVLLEWGVARSQDPKDGPLQLAPCFLMRSDLCGVTGSWRWAILALLIGSGLALSGAWLRRAITHPAFVVDASQVFHEEILDDHVAVRTVRLWRQLGDDAALANLSGLAASDPKFHRALLKAARPYVEWMQTRLIEILSAFPAADRIELRIPREGFGPAHWDRCLRERLTTQVIKDLNTGFRGNQPVTLRCGDERINMEPRSSGDREACADGMTEPMMKVAIKAMSRI